MGWTRSWPAPRVGGRIVGAGAEEWPLVGMGFLSGMMEMFWDHTVVMACTAVNTLKAVDLYALNG